jgi:hypothetical protein
MGGGRVDKRGMESTAFHMASQLAWSLEDCICIGKIISRRKGLAWFFTIMVFFP